MDLALFFVLPLIGGFAFATTFDLLRYRTGREEAQRLYYRAALIGVLLAGLAALLHIVLNASSRPYGDFANRLAAMLIAPLLEKERSTGTVAISTTAAAIRTGVVFACLYGFLIGALTPLWNLLIRTADWGWLHFPLRRRPTSFLDRLNLRAITDQLERLIAEALANHSLVMITLNNSKVYVGSVLESLNPASPAKYFKIQPWMSGYRSSADGRVTFNTYYDAVLASLEEDEAMREAVASFQLVIPIDKVVSASGFDLDAFERFGLERTAAEHVDGDDVGAPTATQGRAGTALVVATAALLLSLIRAIR